MAHEYGWIRPDGKRKFSLYHYKHAGVATELGYKGQFDALQKGAIRYNLENDSCSFEVTAQHAKKAADLLYLLGDLKKYFVDIVKISGNDYDIVDGDSFNSLTETIRYLKKPH